MSKKKKLNESDRAFLGRALLLYAGTGRELPEWGKQALKELLAPQEHLLVRWRAVRAARQRRLPLEGKRGAYQAASDELAGTLHKGSPRTMKRAYLQGQKITRPIRLLKP